MKNYPLLILLPRLIWSTAMRISKHEQTVLPSHRRCVLAVQAESLVWEWMDDVLFYVLFNSVSVIPGQ